MTNKNDNRKDEDISKMKRILKFTLIALVLLLLLTATTDAVGKPLLGSPLPPKVVDIDLGPEILDMSQYGSLGEILRGLPEDATVNLYLHNYGGSVNGLAYLSNALLKTKAHVKAIVDGPTYSAGAFLACYADEIDLYPNSTLMFHIGSMMIPGLANTHMIDTIITSSKRLIVNSMTECQKKGITTEQDLQDVLNGRELYVFPKGTDGQVFK
jgi:hypothetical protein